MFGELLERDMCAITVELGLSDVLQRKTSKFTICLYAVQPFNCIFHHFDVRLCHKENTENVEASANFFSGTLVSR